MASDTDLSNTLSGGSDQIFDVCCSPCLNNGTTSEAEKYCVDCKMYYCGLCLRYHNRIPSSRGHQIIDKVGSDVGCLQSELPTKRCMTHHGKLMDMYCNDHEVVCCGACIAVKHRTCVKVEYLPDVARGIKESGELKDVQGLLHTVLCELREEQTRRLHNCSSLEKENETISGKIDELEEVLINKIRTAAQLTREKLETKFSESRRALEDDIITLNIAIAKIASAEDNISIGNEAEVFTKVKNGKAALKDVERFLAELSKQSKCKKLYFIPDDELKTEILRSDFIGIINIEEEQEQTEESY